MQIQGITLADFDEIVELASKHAFSGNLITHSSAHETHSGVTARLAVRDSRGLGSRVSASGRHGPYACWHTYREVLRWLFYFNPEAKVRTAMANYIGRDGFEENYPATANINVGSQIEPRYMTDLCNCPTNIAIDWELAAEQIGNWRTNPVDPSEQWEIAQYEHAVREAEAVLS